MYKEIVITIIVLVLIIVGNIVTQNNTNTSVEEISKELNTLMEEVQKEQVSQENAKLQMEKIEKVWKEKYETMAYYIEHNELEKVETEIVKIKADIEVEEYKMANESIGNCNFVLEHIKDKNALKIVNIF